MKLRAEAQGPCEILSRKRAGVARGKGCRESMRGFVHCYSFFHLPAAFHYRHYYYVFFLLRECGSRLENRVASGKTLAFECVISLWGRVDEIRKQGKGSSPRSAGRPPVLVSFVAGVPFCPIPQLVSKDSSTNAIWRLRNVERLAE